MPAREWNSARLTPRQKQRQAQLLTGYGAIALRRVDNDAVVEIETIPGHWITIIRESLDSNFSHIIEPIGIEEEMRRAGYSPEKGA